MAEKRFSNVIGFDDAPFDRDSADRVKVVGTVYAGLRFDGVLIGDVAKDGFDAAQRMAELMGASRFLEHIQLILLQGIAVGGFNVVDVFELHERLGLPVLVVARKQPDMDKIRSVLRAHIAMGDRKWRIIERLGAMEPLNAVHVQRVGLTLEQAAAVMAQFAVHGHIPEPLRTAHLIAGALSCGHSRGSV